MTPVFHLKLAFEDDLVRIQTDDLNDFISVEWLRHPSGKEFREMSVTIGSDHLLSGYRYHLSDVRAINYLEIAEQNWLLKNRKMFYRESQFRKIASITSRLTLELMDMLRLRDDLQGQIEPVGKTKVEIFTSKAEALAWLFSDVP
ncbi:hypothetical protein [Adhaeribacter aquaticus]|uniref:hypothetical protein n=1 Tax=Adhaeribacter aquaticus TaxID=299567 RepID=UPI0004240E2F|nr:hypothetical protein [Adhaeribacter aquaticus]